MKLKAIFPTSTTYHILPTTYSKARQTLSERSESKGFTIVELLVVIVVIGILAAITIVSYTGISSKAAVASLQSDLTNSSKLLKMYYTDYGVYPVIPAGTNCPTYPTVDNKYCLKPSSNNTFTYSPSSGTTGSSTYTLSATNGTTTYSTNNNSSIISPAPLSPVADWLATPLGDHYGNYYDLISHSWATVTRAASSGAPAGTTGKTIYDPTTQKIYDVPANYLAINPRSDGKSGSEAVIESSRINYLLNSSFEVDSNSDGLSDSFSEYRSTINAPIWSRTASSIYGTAQRMQYNAVTGDAGKYLAIWSVATDVGTFMPGDTATLSFWIKGSVTGCTFKPGILSRSIGDGYIANSQATIVPTSTWQKVTIVYSNLPANTSRLSIMPIYSDNLTDTSAFDVQISAAQLEKGAFPTSYIPTTTTAVTRNADVVNVPSTNWSAVSGTIAMVNGHSLSADTSNATAINWMTPGNEEGISIYQQYNSNSVNFRTRHVSTDATATKTVGNGINVWSGVYSSGTPVLAYVNGTAGTNGSNNILPVGLPSTATIGSYNTIYYFFNGPIQRAIIYSSALSSTDVSTVTSAIQNGP